MITFNVADKLRLKILDGTLKPGDMLPTENQLAAGLNVGRNPIREAVARLIAEGLLRIARGKGTRVKHWLHDGSFELLLDQLRLRHNTPAAPELMTQILWLRRLVYAQVPALLPPGADLTHVGSEAWDIRCGNHHGHAWTALPEILPAEERVLCALAEQTKHLPLMMLAHAIKRILAMVSRSGPPRPLTPHFDAFNDLARTPTVEALDTVCRLREATYLELLAPVAPAEPAASPAP